MRKILLILFIIASLNAHAQTGWVQSYSNNSKSLYNAFFININTGWVFGDSGMVIKTTDRGYTWKTLYTNINCLLRDVYFLNTRTGWAAGGYIDPWHPKETARMVLLKTTNGRQIADIYQISFM